MMGTIEPRPNAEKTELDRAVAATTATKVAKLLHRIAADEIEKYEHARIFAFPFSIDEQLIRKLDAEVRDRLQKILPAHAVEFQSETRFSDLSSVRFDSFDRFLDKAGDKKDPERVRLTWNKFALDNNGEPIAGEVRIAFITEKRLRTQDFAPLEFNHAFVEMTVSGSDQDWVEHTFEALSPYIDATKLGGVLRPLWLFRNKWFIIVLGQVLSWMGFFIGMRAAGYMFSKSARLERDATLSDILAQTDIAAKFDLYVTYLLTPNRIPWWEPIVVLSVGALAFGLVYITGGNLLPRLTPNSSIAIGLTSRRATSYLNSFKFVVFSILFLGILLPLFVELLKFLF